MSKERAVCIDAGPTTAPDALSPPLVKGEVYEVSGRDACKCGVTVIDVGIPALNHNMMCRCSCGKQRPHGGVWWVKASRFRPLIEDLTASLAETEVKRQVIERPEHVNEPSPSHA